MLLCTSCAQNGASAETANQSGLVRAHAGDSELNLVIQAWPFLPAPIRIGVLAIVKASHLGAPGGTG